MINTRPAPMQLDTRLEHIQDAEVRREQIDMDRINVSVSAQPRVRLNSETIQEYADDMSNGDVFPPVSVFFDGSEYWLADGYHRHAANRQVGFKEIEAEVRDGSLDDALAWSLRANAHHGMRRSNLDKVRAVRTVLEHTVWRKMSDNAIAHAIGVSQPFVSRVRTELINGGQSHDDEPRVARDGRPASAGRPRTEVDEDEWTQETAFLAINEALDVLAFDPTEVGMVAAHQHGPEAQIFLARATEFRTWLDAMTDAMAEAQDMSRGSVRYDDTAQVPDDETWTVEVNGDEDSAVTQYSRVGA